MITITATEQEGVGRRGTGKLAAFMKAISSAGAADAGITAATSGASGGGGSLGQPGISIPLASSHIPTHTNRRCCLLPLARPNVRTGTTARDQPATIPTSRAVRFAGNASKRRLDASYPGEPRLSQGDIEPVLTTNAVPTPLADSP